MLVLDQPGDVGHHAAGMYRRNLDHRTGVGRFDHLSIAEVHGIVLAGVGPVEDQITAAHTATAVRCHGQIGLRRSTHRPGLPTMAISTKLLMFSLGVQDGDHAMLRRVQWRQVTVAVVAATIVALLMGVPSALLINPVFARMTPVPWWSYAVWVLTAVLSGVLVATYARHRTAGSFSAGRTAILANVGSVLAVGCPLCNKLVVATFGVTGALTVWAPLQPLVAAASLAVLGWALWRRLATSLSCPVGDDDAQSPTTAMVLAAPERDI